MVWRNRSRCIHRLWLTLVAAVGGNRIDCGQELLLLDLLLLLLARSIRLTTIFGSGVTILWILWWNHSCNSTVLNESVHFCIVSHALTKNLLWIRRPQALLLWFAISCKIVVSLVWSEHIFALVSILVAIFSKIDLILSYDVGRLCVVGKLVILRIVSFCTENTRLSIANVLRRRVACWSWNLAIASLVMIIGIVFKSVSVVELLVDFWEDWTLYLLVVHLMILYMGSICALWRYWGCNMLLLCVTGHITASLWKYLRTVSDKLLFRNCCTIRFCTFTAWFARLALHFWRWCHKRRVLGLMSTILPCFLPTTFRLLILLLV